jgi:hypothetical protein
MSSRVARLAAAAPALARAFATRPPAAPAAPVSSAAEAAAADIISEGGGGGGWYDPASIDRRLKRKRRVPLDEDGNPVRRTKPGPSEEDMWMQAGAPGYGDVDRSNDGT